MRGCACAAANDEGYDLMAALPPNFDLAKSKIITRFSVYRSRYKRCSLCIIPSIVRRQVLENWRKAVADSKPFTVMDAKKVGSARCGECSLKGWPKVSMESGTLFLHLASNNRRKMK
ncbi:MAG TPA: hypothetical protein DHW67_25590 [Agrobacterium sp.]|nr:hypothetical protein [Agrobacterium sp.]